MNSMSKYQNHNQQVSSKGIRFKDDEFMNSKYCLHEYLNIFCVFIEAAGNSLIDSTEFIVYKHVDVKLKLN